MLKKITFLVLIISITSVLSSEAKEDLITISEKSDRMRLATGKSVFIQTVCPEGSVLISGGGEYKGFLNTEHRVALTKSAPDSI